MRNVRAGKPRSIRVRSVFNAARSVGVKRCLGIVMQRIQAQPPSFTSRAHDMSSTTRWNAFADSGLLQMTATDACGSRSSRS